ncbi:MAG TPA: hypothetical protein PKM43_07930, partial [Verrucomicrobiota bacterium]|nr:hypothetical protein [Verrucomicrobiota bacterium]
MTNLQEFQGGTNPTVSDTVPITLEERQFLPNDHLQMKGLGASARRPGLIASPKPAGAAREL